MSIGRGSLTAGPPIYVATMSLTVGALNMLRGVFYFRNEQVLFQLPKNAPDAFSFEKNQEMHEFRQHANASFRSGAEGLSSVLWHDIVEVNMQNTALIRRCYESPKSFGMETAHPLISRSSNKGLFYS